MGNCLKKQSSTLINVNNKKKITLECYKSSSIKDLKKHKLREIKN